MFKKNIFLLLVLAILFAFGKTKCHSVKIESSHKKIFCSETPKKNPFPSAKRISFREDSKIFLFLAPKQKPLPLAKQKFHSVKIEFSQTKKNCS
jgi:hypothetical protein